MDMNWQWAIPNQNCDCQYKTCCFANKVSELQNSPDKGCVSKLVSSTNHDAFLSFSHH